MGKKSDMKRTKKKRETKTSNLVKEVDVLKKEAISVEKKVVKAVKPLLPKVMYLASHVKQTLFLVLSWLLATDQPLRVKIARGVLLSAMICLVAFTTILCLFSGPLGIALLFGGALLFWAVKNAI